MFKLCTICRSDKPHSDFNRAAGRKDGLQTHCRECNAVYSRRYYQSHTEEHRETTRKRRQQRRRLTKQRIDNIKRQLKCSVCGESDIACLDFHHIDPASKEFDIAMAMNYEGPWDTVLAEIRKCVCLCANCHRKVHAGRFEVTEAMLCDV